MWRSPTKTGVARSRILAPAKGRIYNIGSNNSVELSRFIEIIEERVGKKAEKNLLPLQPGDVPATYANVDDLIDDVGYKPSTTVEEGIANFVDWYRDFYKV